MRLLLPLITTLILINSAKAQAVLPYDTGFEPEGGFVDEAPLSENWATTNSSAVITNETAQSGTQSVRIPSADPENILSLSFDPSGSSILFVDYYMQLTASVLPNLPSFTAPETTALIAVQPVETGLGEWAFLDGDGSGNGVWFTAGEEIPLDGSDRTGWHRVTLRFNLTSDSWDVYIDGVLLAINLGFVEALTAGSEAINIYGSRSGVAYLDTFSLTASNPLFADADLDGIDDAFETLYGMDVSVDDRDLDPDSDGLSNIEEYVYATEPDSFNADEGILSEVLFNRTYWYVDAINGDDANGVGSAVAPFQSLSAVLSLNNRDPDYVGAGDTIYLAAGEYNSALTEIDTVGLSIEGALDGDGLPVTKIGNLKVTAADVTLKNLDFYNSQLTVQGATGVTVTNNLFSGSVSTSLSLVGASDNVISHNRFASAQYHSVMLSWDSAVETASNDNQFIRNYFTHRASGATNEAIYCAFSPGNKNSLNARNRFTGCAFEETVSGNLTRVITDEGTWWMTDTAAHPYQYSVRFEDCYFKHADRAAAFSEFVITTGWPDLAWRWDELANDIWVSTNNEYAITGDYNDWNLEPRIQFVDGDGNYSIIETSHNAGLLVPGNSAPEITSIAVTSVDEGSLYNYTITVTDMDAGDVVTLSTLELPTWLSFDGATLSGEPTASEVGLHTVEIIATDTSGSTDTQLFTITVNAAVVAAPVNLEYVSILFNSDYAYNYAGSISGTIRGLGAEYADYSIQVIANVDIEYPIGTTDINPDGSWSIGHVGTGQKIARLYSKTDEGTVLAEAYGEGLNNTSGSPDSYANQNDAPGLDAIANPITLAENAGEQTLALTGIHDGDHGTQTISINAVSDNQSLIANPVVNYDLVNSPETATLSFTPQTNTSGTATITLTLQDNGGTKFVGGTTWWRRLTGKDTKKVSVEIIVGSGESTTPTIIDRTDWYVDAINGNDATGNGSEIGPFSSLATVLSLNKNYPGFVGTGDTIYLAEGEYDPALIEIDIAGLSIAGTLNDEGQPMTKIGNLTITTADVTLKNLDFHNTQLTLQGASGTEITNNAFSGSVSTSLSLIGASNNVISHNYFASAQYHSVMLSWNEVTETASNDNQFIRNYFTHGALGATNEAIYCAFSPGNNNSLNARNRFIECAFEETVHGDFIRVITDEGTWWMTDTAAHPYQYSVRFEDCYFKRADRAAAFSEFVITEGWPDLAWRWDELTNDTWVSANNSYAITGDYNDWNLEPRIQFIDGDGNNSNVEASHDAGLLSKSSDTDADGLPDDWEQQIIDADPDDSIVTFADVDPDADFDEDGISNADEFARGRLPDFTDADVALYADSTLGDDTNYSGFSAVPGKPTAADGPKASVANTLGVAEDTDIILLQSGAYDETTLSVNGKNLTLRINGPVIIR